VEEENARRGFKVEDRRRFSATGEPREETAQETAPPEAPLADISSEPAPSTAEAPQHSPLGDLTFSGFVIGLSTQALVLLGETTDPSAPSGRTDLAGAKQLIDILGMLHAKTKGNLDEAESQLLDDALYDLRMRYVQRSRSK